MSVEFHLGNEKVLEMDGCDAPQHRECVQLKCTLKVVNGMLGTFLQNKK